MLEDYRKYLLGIRNNLIQCGVEFPVSPCMEYRELFELGCNLDSLLWYYSVLEISGSEDRLKGFYLPLGNHFKDRMKRVFYEEFQMFLKDYNKLSVRSYLSNPKYKNLENISDIYSNAGENLVKLIDIGVDGSVSTETSESSVGRVEYVECGRYLEDYVGEDVEGVEGLEEAKGEEVRGSKDVKGSEDVREPEREFVPNGLYLEDYSEVVEDMVEAIGGELRDSVERVSHGLYLEEYIEGSVEESDDWLEESEDEPDSDWLEEAEEEPESDWSEEPESDWSEEAEETDDWVEESEDDWSEVEESEEDWVEEPEEEANSDWLEEDESDSDWLEEESEETDDWVEEEESDWVEEDESGTESDDWIEESGNDWVEEPEEEADSDWIEEPESDWVEEEEVPVKHSRVQPKSGGNGSPVGNQPKEKPKTYEKDISDYIQDFTNGLLTSGKRAIIKGLRKLDK